MAGVMNLAGYVAVGHHHPQGSVFTIISIHIVGMYGLVLFVGDAIERIGRRRSMVIGLGLIALSNAGMAWFGSIAGMSLAMFGLGLGWCLSYIAATTELVDLAGPSERGRLVGLSDLLSSFGGAGLALAGGVVYTGAGGSVPLAWWRQASPSWRAPGSRATGSPGRSRPGDCCYHPAPADAWSALSPYEDLQRQTGRDSSATGSSSTPRGRPWAGLRP